MSNLSKCDDDPDLRQESQRILQIIATVGDFLRQRPVAWRQAFYRIEDNGADKLQIIVGLSLVCTLCQPELEQCRIEELA